MNKKGNPNWNKIFFNEWVSKDALKLKRRELVIKEHIVPVKVITQKLRSLGTNCDLIEIEQLLVENLHFATITKDENNTLNKYGLAQKMPDSYYDKGSSLYNNAFARYEFAEINLNRS